MLSKSPPKRIEREQPNKNKKSEKRNTDRHTQNHPKTKTKLKAKRKKKKKASLKMQTLQIYIKHFKQSQTKKISKLRQKNTTVTYLEKRAILWQLS